MTTRIIFKLEIYSFNHAVPSETRHFEAANWTEASKIKNMLLAGRPYYSLTQETEVLR